MYSIQEQFRSDALAQLNSRVVEVQQIAGNLLEISHEIGVLNVRTGRASAEAVAGAVQKLLSASNPVEFFQLATTVMRPDLQVWTDYAEQLRGIAGKMAAPASAAPEAENPGKPLEDLARAEAAPLDLQGVVPPAALSEPVPEPPVLVEPVEPAAAAQPQPPASSPEIAAPAPEAPQAVQEVTEAINHVAKTAPVISAASAPSVEALSKSAVIPDAAAAKLASKQPPQKTNPLARPANRSKKG